MVVDWGAGVCELFRHVWPCDDVRETWCGVSGVDPN